jgi:hypothetical protein
LIKFLKVWLTVTFGALVLGVIKVYFPILGLILVTALLAYMLVYLFGE